MKSPEMRERYEYYDLMLQFAYEWDELPITTVRQILELLKQAKEEK